MNQHDRKDVESGDGNVTRLLHELSGGNQTVVDSIMSLIYRELHGLARKQMMGERANHSLNATGLIHEVYLKLVDQRQANWQNRAHFMSIAALAMRRILVDHAKRRTAAKRGGGEAMVTFCDDLYQRQARPDQIVALDKALTNLKKLSERQSKVIDLWFFGGLKHEEIAEVLQVSVPTVRRDWRLARAWLTSQLGAV